MNFLERRKRSYLIAGLSLILVLMAVAYAVFNQQLKINGTAGITSNWCVGFDSSKTNTYTASSGLTGGTVPTASMTYNGNVCGGSYNTGVTLSSTFKQPGDEVVYTLTIKNASTLNAKIDSIAVDDTSITSNQTITKGNIKFIIEMPESTSLSANASTTMKVTTKFQNDTDITGTYSGESNNVTVKINASQDDGSGGMIITEPKFTGSIYRWSTVSILNGSTIKSKTIYNITSDGIYGHGPAGDYDTLEECEEARTNNYGGYGECKEFLTDPVAGAYTKNASALNKTYYLKHDVEEDIITGSYVCFIYNNAEHCMKGADGGASFIQNNRIINDYQTFYNLNTVTIPSSSNLGCFLDSSVADCYGGDFIRVYADSSGIVNVRESSKSCDVRSDGSSRCLE